MQFMAEIVLFFFQNANKVSSLSEKKYNFVASKKIQANKMIQSTPSEI